MKLSLLLLLLMAWDARASIVQRDLSYKGRDYAVVFDKGTVAGHDFVEGDKAEPRLLLPNNPHHYGIRAVIVYRMFHSWLGARSEVIAKFPPDQLYLCGECQSDPFMWLKAALDLRRQLAHVVLR